MINRCENVAEVAKMRNVISLSPGDVRSHSWRAVATWKRLIIRSCDYRWQEEDVLVERAARSKWRWRERERKTNRTEVWNVIWINAFGCPPTSIFSWRQKTCVQVRLSLYIALLSFHRQSQTQLAISPIWKLFFFVNWGMKAKISPLKAFQDVCPVKQRKRSRPHFLFRSKGRR